MYGSNILLSKIPANDTLHFTTPEKGCVRDKLTNDLLTVNTAGKLKLYTITKAVHVLEAKM
jgi:hypothetical protein